MKTMIYADSTKRRSQMEPEISELEKKIAELKKLLDEEKSARIKLGEYTRQLGRRIWQLEKDFQRKHMENLEPSLYEHELIVWFYQKTGKILNIKHPETYNEKIQWFKLYGITPVISELSDKIAVREFVASRIGKEYLVPLIGVWNYPEEIDFDLLPEKFVLKANHGSGYNYVVTDKNSLDTRDVIMKANHWLQQDFSFSNGFEMQYHSIPRRLLAEQYLENEGGDLYDYKVWCFNGHAEYIQFLSQRKTDLKMDFFDREWKLQPFTYNHPNSGMKICKPDNLGELIDKAELLARGFPHVRVDFYRLNTGKLYFGEMTFTSFSGICQWDPPETDLMLGRLFTYSDCLN